MSDDTAAAGANADGGTPQPRPSLSLVINVQYVKDLSFENPNAPQSLIASGNQPPKIELAVDVQARGLQENVAEVALTLRAEATLGERTAYIAEVVYAGVFTLPQIPQDQARAVLLVEAPRLLFPFARQVLATAVQQGGFPPLMLQPLDFVDIYRRQAMGAQGQQPTVADSGTA